MLKVTDVCKIRNNFVEMGYNPKHLVISNNLCDELMEDSNLKGSFDDFSLTYEELEERYKNPITIIGLKIIKTELPDVCEVY